MKVIKMVKFEHVDGSWVKVSLVELNSGKCIVDVEGTCQQFNADAFRRMMDVHWVENDPDQAFKTFVYIIVTRKYMRVVEYEVNDGQKVTNVKAA